MEIIEEYERNLANIVGGAGTAALHLPGQSHKNETVAKLIPDAISECALYLGRAHDEPCVDNSTTVAIENIVKSGHKSNREIIAAAKSHFNCESEKCVIENVAESIGRDKAKQIINSFLKIEGPTDSRLLSNVNIDGTLAQWAQAHKEFFAYNFNMLDYASHSFVNGEVLNRPDSLATVYFPDLYAKNDIRCAGCVINSDTYSGSGKHWMALFADARDQSEWTVEFFNSSGNSPAPEFVNWMVKTKNAMENMIESWPKERRPKISVVKVSSIQHQKSKSECGLYSLFYIWARLNEVPYTFFQKNKVDDQLMFEFRQHLFDDPRRKRLKSFDWDAYKSAVKIGWESA